MDAMPQLYKIVGPEGECLNGGSGAWPLPTATEPGAWYEVGGPLEACRNGLHLTDAEHISQWSRADGRAMLYRAEVDGECIPADGKWVARKVRLLPRRKAAPNLDAAARDKLETRRQRAMTRAAEAAHRAESALVKPPATGYLQAVSGLRLPAGHPLADKANATAAYLAARDAIRDKARAAQLEADAAYRRAIAPAVDPRLA